MSRPAAQHSRRSFLRLAGAGAAAGAMGFPAIVRAGSRTRNVIVLGFDGMDPSLLMRFVSEGRLPNIQRLMRQGSFVPLRTSDPPQSPVAWSNFISGTNPGGHGIYDFIAREARTLVPYLSTSRISGGEKSLTLGDLVIPLSARRVENMRKGPTFWNDLQEHAMDCTVIGMPANFPPTPTKAQTLAGLGTPDLHGGYGIFTYYTDERSQRSRDVSGGRIERVGMHNHSVKCMLPGPVNTFDRDGEKVDIPLDVYVDPSNRTARLTIQGQELVLAEGEWSRWVTVRFPMVRHLAEVAGICRLYLKSAREPFGLYASPVNIDPKDPALPISSPESYSRRIARNFGDFYTQGMAEDTAALSSGVFTDDEYRDQATFVFEEDLRLFEHEFARFREGMFFFYFSTLDLNSHMFWRTLDEKHPQYSAELTARHGDFVPWLYGKLDEAVGQALARTDERTLLMVLSDHGFGSFRRQFNLNSWLMDNGYAAALNPRSRGRASYFADVNWGRTRAYGLGINGLYLNMAGREPNGSVARGAQETALAAELIKRLKAVRDPQTGEVVISNVYQPSDIYSGPCLADAPDLVVCYNANYRASWDTILGSYPKQHILDNMDPWSGDHVMDALFMSGVLLCNRPVRDEHPALTDLAPSILAQCGVPVPEGMTGRSVL